MNETKNNIIKIMSNDDIKLVKEFFKKQNIKISNLTLDTKVTDLGLDSLDLMMVIVEIEKKYNLHLEDEALLNIKTIGDLVSLIKQN